MSDAIYLEKTTAMMTELKKLRAQNKALAEHVGLLKKQYDDLAADHDALITESRHKIHAAYTSRDVSERSLSEIKITLSTVAETIMQALRAEAGAREQAERPNTVTALHSPSVHPMLRKTLDDGENNGNVS